MTTLFSDNFNRANSAVLGNNWVQDAGTFDIFSNTLREPTMSAAFDDYAHNTTSIGGVADYQVQADTLPVASSPGGGLGVVGRMADTSNLYLAHLYTNPGIVCETYKRVAGAFTNLSSVSTSSITGTVLLGMQGTHITSAVNGVRVSNVVDSALTAAGSFGVRNGDPGGASGHAWDNFLVLDFSVPPQLPRQTALYIPPPPPFIQPPHLMDALLKIPSVKRAPVFQPDPFHVMRHLREIPWKVLPHLADPVVKIPSVRAAPVFQPDPFHVLRHLRELPLTKLIPGIDVEFAPPSPGPPVPAVNPYHVMRHLRELPLVNLIPGKDVSFTAPRVDAYTPEANLYHVLRHLRELPGVKWTPGDNVGYLGPYVVSWSPTNPRLLVVYLRDDVLRPQIVDKLQPFLYINIWVPDADPMYTLKRM